MSEQKTLLDEQPQMVPMVSPSPADDCDDRFEGLSSISDAIDAPQNILYTKAETSNGDNAQNDIQSMSSATARLPDLGNVDREKLRLFRDSYLKNNFHGSLQSKEGEEKEESELNKLNINGFKYKPIGRDDEIKQLHDAFEATVNAQGPTVVAIKGASGTGKSILARQIQNAVNSASGFYCTGHFLDNNEPYTGFSQAMTDLAQQIWSKDQQFVQDFVERCEDSIAEDIPILLSFVPFLTKIGFKFNKYVEQEEINVANRANQLFTVIRKFIKALCVNKNPLVLVLDDVHWADPSSALLMTSLVTNKDNKYLCLIATSPADDISMTACFESMELLNVPIREIPLGDLSFDDAHRVVCMALQSDGDEDRIIPLTRLVYEKTRGNPFFVLTFLQSLIDEDLMDYNLSTRSFSWNLEAIQGKNATDNVGDLTAASLGKLSPEIQSLLQVCGCLSQTFNNEEVAYVIKGVKQSTEFKDTAWPANIDQALGTLSAQGILTPHWLPSTYSFVHGQTKMAAVNLVPFTLRSRFRLVVGRRLLDGMDDQSKTEKYLCLATDLCNAGLGLLKRSELLDYAKWNLKAGDFTLQKGAFESALKYFEIGIQCLGEDYWDDYREEGLLLHCGACEAAYCCGNFEKNERLSYAVLESDEQFTIQECLRIYATRISVLGAQERFIAAVDIGRHVLKELGMVDLPKSPSLLMVFRALMKTKRIVKGQTKDTLMSLPACKDQNRVSAMKIINLLATMAYIANPNFFLVMFLKSMRWTVKYGMTQFSPVAICTYGVIASSVMKDAKEGLKFGEAALEIAKERNLRLQRAFTISGFYGFVHHWTQPIHLSFLPLAYGHQLGMETGDTEIAFLNIVNHDAFMVLCGTVPLQEMVASMEQHYKSMEEYKQDAMKSFAALIYQFALNLIGEDENKDPKKLTGSIMNENRFRRIAKEKKNRLLEVMMDAYRNQLTYIFNDMEASCKIAESIMDFGVDVGQGSFQTPRHMLMVGLSHTGVAAGCSDNKIRKKHLKVALAMKKTLQRYVDSGNPNCPHMLKLLVAEISNVTSATSVETEEFYKEAVAAVTQTSFIRDRALAHERAALFFLNKYKGELFWATYHMKNAVQAYQEWGAIQKVKQLRTKHKSLLETQSSGNVVQT